MQADPVTELAQPRHGVDALRRGEVVEDRLGHQEVGGGHASARPPAPPCATRRPSARSTSCRRNSRPARGPRRTTRSGSRRRRSHPAGRRSRRDPTCPAAHVLDLHVEQRRGGIGPRQSLVGRVGHGDHIAAAVAVDLHGADRSHRAEGTSLPGRRPARCENRLAARPRAPRVRRAEAPAQRSGSGPRAVAGISG